MRLAIAPMSLHNLSIVFIENKNFADLSRHADVHVKSAGESCGNQPSAARCRCKTNTQLIENGKEKIHAREIDNLFLQQKPKLVLHFFT